MNTSEEEAGNDPLFVLNQLMTIVRALILQLYLAERIKTNKLLL